ncbi:hypothetical protein [Azospirillum halopraeferens]|uniref:hypothetical protein n=1 Tax=Azospirillum halopraeferens TaxID=34010 RepID=UPI0003F70ED6|nr:hypothetical protein [Azospirillum halopraeferens]
MTRAVQDLALVLGVDAYRLRRGLALDQASRRALADHLLLAAVALSGRTPPARVDADPAALIAAAVETARAAGVPAPEIVAAVNDALERCVRPN